METTFHRLLLSSYSRIPFHVNQSCMESMRTARGALAGPDQNQQEKSLQRKRQLAFGLGQGGGSSYSPTGRKATVRKKPR